MNDLVHLSALNGAVTACGERTRAPRPDRAAEDIRGPALVNFINLVGNVYGIGDREEAYGQDVGWKKNAVVNCNVCMANGWRGRWVAGSRGGGVDGWRGRWVAERMGDR